MNQLVPCLDSYLFERIFSHINKLESQVLMVQGMPEFQDDAVREWRRLELTSTLGPNSNLQAQFSNTKDYTYFLNLMAPHFKRFVLMGTRPMSVLALGEYLEQLRSMGIKILPGVEVCRLKPLNSDIVDNDNIREMAIMMPNVRVLEATKSLSGQYLEGFKKLEELYLYTRWFPLPLESCHVQNICVNMKSLRILDIRNGFVSGRVTLTQIKLPMLEVLQLNLRTLSNIIPDVLELPKLQKLGVNLDRESRVLAITDQTFQKILCAMAPHITNIAVNNMLLPLTHDWDINLGVISLPKLRQFTFDGWQYPEPFLKGHDIQKSQIKHIGINSWKEATAESIIGLIREHPNLRELSLFRCHVNDILWEIEKFLVSQASAGNQRPKLHIYKYFNRSRRIMKWGDKKYWRDHQFMYLDRTVHNSFTLLENGFEFEFDRN